MGAEALTTSSAVKLDSELKPHVAMPPAELAKLRNDKTSALVAAEVALEVLKVLKMPINEESTKHATQLVLAVARNKHSHHVFATKAEDTKTVRRMPSLPRRQAH